MQTVPHLAEIPYVVVMYGPAYRYGINTYTHYKGQPYQDIDEQALQSGWKTLEKSSGLSWDEAREAVSEAYSRVSHNYAEA